MAQLVKNLPAMWETWVGKIPWRREHLPTLVFWPGEFYTVHGSQRGGHDLAAFTSLHFCLVLSRSLPRSGIAGV